MKIFVYSLVATSLQSFSYIGQLFYRKNHDNAYFIIVAMATILDVQPEFCYEIKESTLAGHCIPSAKFIGRNLQAKLQLPRPSGFRENHDTVKPVYKGH